MIMIARYKWFVHSTLELGWSWTCPHGGTRYYKSIGRQPNHLSSWWLVPYSTDAGCCSTPSSRCSDSSGMFWTHSGRSVSVWGFNENLAPWFLGTLILYKKKNQTYHRTRNIYQVHCSSNSISPYLEASSHPCPTWWWSSQHRGTTRSSSMIWLPYPGTTRRSIWCTNHSEFDREGSAPHQSNESNYEGGTTSTPTPPPSYPSTSGSCTSRN